MRYGLKGTFEGDVQELVLDFIIDPATGSYTAVLNTRSPLTFGFDGNDLEITCPADFETTFARDGDDLARQYVI